MKRVIVFSFAFFVGIVAFAQKIAPSSNIIKEQRTVLNFSQLAVYDGIEVTVVFTGTEKIEIQAPDNVVQYIETVVEKNVLNVRLQKGLKLRGNAVIKIAVNMKSLTKITAVNKSKITVENPLSADKLEIKLENASLIGNIAAQKASVSLTKGAQVDLIGTCKELKLNMSGASSLTGTKFAADVLEAKLNGQSTARLTIVQSLEFNGAKGSNLYYLGSPKIKSIKASGDSGCNKE